MTGMKRKSTCSVPECPNPTQARGLCKTHYAKASGHRAVDKHRRRLPGSLSFTAAEARERVAEYAGRCAYCGGPWAHLDHMVPLARGGTNTIENIVPACQPCNTLKAARPLLLFACQEQRFGS